MIEFVFGTAISFVGEMVIEFFSWVRFKIRHLKPEKPADPLKSPKSQFLPVLVAASALLFCAGQESQVCNAETKAIHPALGNSPWSEPYAYIHENSLGNRSEGQVLQSLPFERIELQRTGCFGTCPIFTVTLFRNGNARYHGEGFVSNIGGFSGSIDPFSFGRLCYLLERLDFTGLDRVYSAPWTCDETVYLRVWRAGEVQPIVIRDYGDYGPIELWGIQQVVEAVANGIRWKADE